MKRRRIVQILEATTGGTRRHLNDVVHGLDPDRFDVHVICALGRDPAFAADVAAMRERGVTVHVVPMVRAVRPGRDLAAVRCVVRLLRRYRYELVHTHSSKAGAVGRLAAAVVRVPAVVHTAHVFPFEMRASALKRCLYRCIERRLARWTDRLICVSSAGMLAAVQSGVAPAGGYAIIVNGVDVTALDRGRCQPAVLKNELGLPAAAPVVGAVGRLTRQKRYDRLIAAAARVCQSAPETRFVILGEGEDRNRLQSQIDELGLTERVIMPGARNDIYACYSMFDVFAMASDWEGLPYSLLEAMGCRRPVIATAVGGVADVIRDGVDGSLVPAERAGRADRLADAILERLRAPAAERQRMGEAARQTIEQRFTLRGMLDALQALYDQLLDQTGQNVTGKERS